MVYSVRAESSVETTVDDNVDGPELYIALITPLGAPTEQLVDAIESELRRYHYEATTIRLSDLLTGFFEDRLSEYRDERTSQLIDLGNQACQTVSDRAAVAALGVNEIVSLRGSEPYLPRRAWIIRSLKRPEEVALLQQTYGGSLYTVALYSGQDRRTARLRSAINATRSAFSADDAQESAEKIISRDEAEAAKSDADSFGQNVLKTFPMADVIIAGDNPAKLESSARRFVRLVFAENECPTHAEHSMYLAEGTAAMSSSLTRKVGASVVTDRGEVVSVGCNEAPRAGGGQYTSESTGGRDADRGADYSDESIGFLAASTVKTLASAGWLNEEKTAKARSDLNSLADEAIKILRADKAPLMSIVEFQRAVHAEIGAILDAGRRGISVKDCTLYTTTYPCHLCTKEIVAAGIKEVVYIEPYPKSRSQAMYGDAIAAEHDCSTVESNGDIVVPIRPFIGVTPRAYRRLFETDSRRRRKDNRGVVINQPPRQAVPKIGGQWPQLSLNDREAVAMPVFDANDDAKGKM